MKVVLVIGYDMKAVLARVMAWAAGPRLWQVMVSVLDKWKLAFGQRWVRGGTGDRVRVADEHGLRFMLEFGSEGGGVINFDRAYYQCITHNYTVKEALAKAAGDRNCPDLNAIPFSVIQITINT